MARHRGAWKAKQGLPDSKGKARHGLYLQKFAATATVSAAYAVVDNIEGLPAAALTELSWEHRMNGHCGAGAPRWNVVVEGQSGTEYTLFLGCAAAAHSQGSGPGWEKDSHTSPGILADGAANSGNSANLPDIQAGTIAALYILFDEGTAQGPGGCPGRLAAPPRAAAEDLAVG